MKTNLKIKSLCIFPKSIVLFILWIFSLFLAIFLRTTFAAWQEPTCDPATCNVEAPINVSALTQTKEGGLNILGSVGIGTDAPSKKLEVSGDIKVVRPVEGEGNIIAEGIVKLGEFNGKPDYNLGAGSIYYDTGQKKPLYWEPTKAEWKAFEDDDWTINGNDMYTSISGNVGIGISTPSYKLHIKSAQDNSYLLYVENTSTTSSRGIYAKGSFAGYFQGKGYFSDNVGIGNTPDSTHKLRVSGLSYFTDNVGIGSSPDTYRLKVSGGDVNINDTLFVKNSNQKIGIGTDNPVYKLQIEDNAFGSTLYVHNTGGFSTAVWGEAVMYGVYGRGRFGVYGMGDYHGVGVYGYSDNGVGIYGSSLTGKAGFFGGDVEISSGDVTIDRDTLFVDSTNHRVGIGTNSPDYPLEVQGEAYFSNSVGIGTIPNSVYDLWIGGTTRVDGEFWIETIKAKNGNVVILLGGQVPNPIW